MAKCLVFVSVAAIVCCSGLVLVGCGSTSKQQPASEEAVTAPTAAMPVSYECTKCSKTKTTTGLCCGAMMKKVTYTCGACKGTSNVAKNCCRKAMTKSLR